MKSPKSKLSADLLIIGGGLVGLATAYKALLAIPGMRVIVLEKEAVPGAHQSSHNSGVLHAGLYYKPGSLKATLAVSGIRELTAFCRENGVANEICGKLVVATDETEVPLLRDLMERGQLNGLQGLEWLDSAGIAGIEPHARGVAALRVPEEGIVDYPGVVKALTRRIREMGGTIATSSRVQNLDFLFDYWAVRTTSCSLSARWFINCAGLHSDRVARLAGVPTTMRIVPFRGEYYKLRRKREFLVRNLIYPVPNPSFPFLGVHFTRMVAGGVECGPNAVLALAREGYRKKDISLRDSGQALLFPGLWMFLARYMSLCCGEVIRSFSRVRFCRALQKLVPAIQPEDLEPGGSGVRAQAMLPDGTLVNDFMLVERRGAMHVLNAPSPGATACLAIADEILRRFSHTAAILSQMNPARNGAAAKSRIIHA